jgi:predicted DNA binding CopG/RHH family protein
VCILRTMCIFAWNNTKAMKKAKQDGTTRIHIVVSQELKEQLKQKADKDGRSLSSLVNWILTEHTKKNAGK